MKIKLRLICLAFVLVHLVNAQEDSKTSLKLAFKQAKVEDKNVLLIFHASWCGWCKKMEKNINAVECKELFEVNYVIAYLTVHESADKKNLENPGALDVLKKYNGENSGLPFWVFLNKKGKLLADSFNDENQNIGCPGAEEEVTQFLDKLKTTSNLTKDELTVISKIFIIKK